MSKTPKQPKPVLIVTADANSLPDTDTAQLAEVYGGFPPHKMLLSCVLWTYLRQTHLCLFQVTPHTMGPISHLTQSFSQVTQVALLSYSWQFYHRAFSVSETGAPVFKGGESRRLHAW